VRYLFDDYTLDTDQRELRRGEALVAVEPKVFDLLAFVICNREKVVSRDDMIEAVWDGRIVSESTLTSCINGARGAVGDNGQDQRFIKTLPRRGIRFVGTVREDRPVTHPGWQPPGFASDLSDTASIAVLPFQAMAGDAELDNFCDGLTEDIITGLSRTNGVWVIARNTMFTYKGRAIDVRTVAKDLGVRYVLEGSVRKADRRLRLTAQLVEAETGHHIWAGKIDRAIIGLFDLQDDFTQCVVASVQTQIIVSEGKKVARRAKTAVGVGDLLTRARERVYQQTAEGLRDLVSLAESILALDPANGEACRLLATGVWHQAYNGFIPWDRAAVDRVMLFAQRAVVAERADEYTHWMLGLAHLMANQHERALVSLRRALDINPSCSLAYGSTGTVLAWQGASETSIASNEIALKINPSDPTNYFRFFGMALAHYLASRYDKALEYAALAVQLRPDWWLALIIYAATLAKAGRLAEARTVCAELKRIRPDMALRLLDDLPFAKQSDREHVAKGLQKADIAQG
jgi:TolB-like protein/Flp pilus assembly protein TadD